MKNKTLHFLLIFCCSYFWLMRLNAQSNIGVNIGLDFMEAKPEPLSFPIYIVGKGFKSQSISFGLRFEQQLSKLFFLSAQGNYSRKRMIAWGAWSPPFDSIAFHRYSAALSINWMPFYFLNIGAGPSGIYSPKIDAYNLGSYRHKLEHERKELGILITVGGIYKQAMLDVNYYSGLKVLGTYKSVLQPLHSINLSLHYLFKLGHKKQGGAKNKSRF